MPTKMQEQCVPERIGLLSWNLHKHRDSISLENSLRIWTQRGANLCLFQEACFTTLAQAIPRSCSAEYSQNLQFASRRYGVATAASFPSSKTLSRQSRSREFFIGPAKPYLITAYPIDEKRSLLVLNLHAINFREDRSYRLELTRVRSHLHRHQGPMIVAGDFNRWNHQREEILENFCRKLGLQKAEIDERNIKKFGRHPLDFIFYRELELLESIALQEEISDHNPLFARFKIFSDKDP